MPVLRWIFAAVFCSPAPSPLRADLSEPIGARGRRFPAGGPTDIIARIVAQNLSDSLGQQFYVENIAGAGGNTASGQVARVTPDGYTIMAISTGFIVNPSLYAKVPYDPLKDFTAVTLVAASPNVVVVNPSVPAKSLPELVQLIKDNPGKYSYAGPGVGSTPHLGGELFRLTYKLDLVHVPFTGAAPAVQLDGRRSHADCVHGTTVVDGGDPGRAGARDSDRRNGARGTNSRRADICRAGRQGSGGRYAHRHRCAGRYTEGYRRSAGARDRQGRRKAGGQGES